jgi:phosphoribosyl 1,2-cyclic phosphodiesterase
MIISCLGSGSNANCFLVTAEKSGEILILDAGVKFKRVTAHKRFTSAHMVAAACVTHHHADHSAAARDIFKACIRVISYDNAEPLKRYYAGGYEIIPFLCPHDGVKNYGYIVRLPEENKTVVYAVDTTALPVIPGVDAWLVECNYTEELWRANVAKSDNLAYYGRVAQSHMSLEYLTGFFSNGKIEPSKAIILCHLSENGNADKAAMTAAMTPYAPLVDIAVKGREWKL